MTLTELYESYVKFCFDNNIVPVSSTRFAAALYIDPSEVK